MYNLAVMSDEVLLSISGKIVVVSLNSPGKKNALNAALFDGLVAAIESIKANSNVHVVLLKGEGSVFCAGFDLDAVVEKPELMSLFIDKLSKVNRSIRRLPIPVVATVQGAAIAGGCALLSACDFVVVEPDAKFGYPVHRIGISPAVTLPTLMLAIGYANARSLVLSGELINGIKAYSIGLATHVAESSENLDMEALELCNKLAAKPVEALSTTKRWLNELDGSLDDEVFEKASQASIGSATGEEYLSMLNTAWSAKSGNY